MSNSIYKKLIEAQTILKAPKNQKNTFGNYNYRSAEDILEAVKPVMKQVGLVLFVSDKMESIGNRVYVTATVTLVDIDTGESLTASASAREAENKKGMDDSQITGATSSYARKYALNGMFCIDDTKDADATNTHGKDVQASSKAAEAVNNMKSVIDNSVSTMKPYSKKVENAAPAKIDYPTKFNKETFEDFQEIFDDENPFATPETKKVGFGKHSDKTYGDLYEMKLKGDNYFDWLLENGKEEAKQNCKQMLEIKKGKE